MRVIADPTISAFKFKVLRSAYMRVYTISLTYMATSVSSWKLKNLAI